MASPQASDVFACNNKIEHWDHDPGATSAMVVSADGGTTLKYADMKDFNRFSVTCVTTVLGGNGPTLLEIVAADNAAMTTNLTQIKTSGTIAADAFGDWAYLECSAEEIAQESADAGATLRYVSARITCHNAGDEALVTFISSEPRFPRDGLTAATTIA